LTFDHGCGRIRTERECPTSLS